jgi:hypothetical protein
MAKTVVLVPGIMGSWLVRDLAPGITQAIWWNPSRLRTGDYAYLQLAEDGHSPGPLARGVALRTSTRLPTWNGWQALVKQLEGDGWRWKFFGYDWRLSVTDNAASLADYLLGSAVIGDFYVLAYSMGSYLARLAYPRVHAAGSAARWKRTLYVAPPHYGSHQAAQYLSTPIQNEDLVGYILPGMLSGKLGGLNPVVRKLLQGKMREIVSTWPALYELLPSIKTPWIDTRPLDPALYVPATYADTNPTVQLQWFNEAKATRDLIDATLTGPRPAERGVLADGQETPDALIRATDIGALAAYSTVDGDGSVTDARATLPGVTTSLTLGQQAHCNVLADGRFLARVDELLTHAEAPPETVEQIKGTVVTELPPPQVVQDPPVFITLQRRNDP